MKTKFKTIYDDEINEEDIKDFLYSEEWESHRRAIIGFNYSKKILHHARITKKSLKLRERLLLECNVNIFPACIRVYSKTKDAGEWNWYVITQHLQHIGSSLSLKELLKQKKFSISKYGEIYGE